MPCIDLTYLKAVYMESMCQMKLIERGTFDEEVANHRRNWEAVVHEDRT